MKKMLLLFVLGTSFLLASCESAISELNALDVTNPMTSGDLSNEDQEELKNDLTDEIIKQALNELMYMESFETTLHYRLVTEEMNLEVNPALKYQVYTNQDGQIMRLEYNNKIMEGLGLQPFELIVDERTESIYINDTNTWHQSTFTELESQLGVDDREGVSNTELVTSIEQINILLLEAAQNFNKATYVESVNDDNRQLAHIVLDYNVRDILKDIFNVYKENNDATVPNFDTMIQMLELEKLAVLFETFEIDVYVDTNTLQVARIELEIATLLKDIYTVMEQEINESIDDESVNVEQILNYLEHLEIGVNISNVNSLDEIVIPEAAKLSDAIDLESWILDTTVGYDPVFGYNDETDETSVITEDSISGEGTDSSTGASVNTDESSTEDTDTSSGATS